MDVLKFGGLIEMGVKNLKRRAKKLNNETRNIIFSLPPSSPMRDLWGNLVNGVYLDAFELEEGENVSFIRARKKMSLAEELSSRIKEFYNKYPYAFALVPKGYRPIFEEEDIFKETLCHIEFMEQSLIPIRRLYRTH